jgi:hypothetical protein
MLSYSKNVTNRPMKSGKAGRGKASEYFLCFCLHPTLSSCLELLVEAHVVMDS